MSSLPHSEETDIPLVQFFCFVVEKDVHPKDTSSGLVGFVLKQATIAIRARVRALGFVGGTEFRNQNHGCTVGRPSLF
eukprot:scaffold117177_cov28-Attheya_sp.AAC.1